MALELYQENSPAGEAKIISDFVAHDTEQHRRAYPPGTRPVHRRLHVKSHACVHAKFSVDSGLPGELAAGVFAEPKTFDAIVRFSNGLRTAQKDILPDARGLSIKLLGVPGRKVLDDEPDALTQDFTLLNSPTFFVRDAESFSGFSRTVDAKGNPLSFLFGWNPLKWRIQESLALFKSTRPIRSPVGVRYWSQVPFRLGSLAVKWSAEPRVGAPLVEPSMLDPDYLHHALLEQFARGPVDFDFSVQVQADPRSMPIEDALTRWDEDRAPFRRVARLHIPKQKFSTSARDAYCENLSFTSWHCLPEHRPLGGINRMRREAYRASQILRHQMNAVPRREPADIGEFFATAEERPAVHQAAPAPP